MKNLTQFAKDVTKPLHQEVYDDLISSENELQQVSSDLTFFQQEAGLLQTEIAKLHSELQAVKSKKPLIDDVLSSRYKKVANIAYQQKRKVGNEYYNVYLNELITPDAWEVLNFKKSIKQVGKTDLQYKHSLGNKLAKWTTWVDEQKLYEGGDYYLYPAETLTGKRKTTDCEDVMNVFVSLFPEESAGCYGLYSKGAEKFGHAYPVTLIDGELYIVECTGNTVEIIPFNDPRYDPYIIVTKSATYKVKDGITFGQLSEPL